MTFILKMAWRDSRASRRRLLLFSLSVVLGIAALVAIGSFGANLRSAIDEQAKGLLGADLIITGRNPPSEAAVKHLDSLGGEKARDMSFSSMMVFPSAQNLTRLVQVRAMEGNFPFFGDFTTAPTDAPAKFRAGGDVVILDETLLRQFNTKVGETVKLGKVTFTVVGALQKMPGESSAITATFAPRALIPMSRLEATGLAGRENLARFRTMLKLPPEHPPEAVEREMRQLFRGEGLGYDTVAERKRDLGRALENIEGFLSLVGFIALFLGAIGVASAIHVYVRQKITTVAILRCLGATAWQSFAVYLVQGIALGVFGAFLGAALGLAVQFALPELLKGSLPFDVNFFIAWPAVLEGMLAGLVICVLFTLLPLLAVRRVSPLVALRSAFAEGAGAKADPWRIVIGVLILGAVTAFAISQTPRLRDGVGFTIALVVGFSVLAGLAQLVAWTARWISSPKVQRWLPGRMPYVLRQGVANLYRPNNRTVLLLLSLGLGTFLMLTLFLTRTTLLQEISQSSGKGRPNLLFIDVQDDQVEGLGKLTAQQGSPFLVQAPIVTMKITTLKGQKAEDLARRPGDGSSPAPAAPGNEKGGAETRPAERGPGQRERLPGWALRREYRSTFRGKLEGTERLVAGEFTGRVDPGTAVVPISMEEGLFRDLRLKLGDEIEWNVQGVPMNTRVTSVRAVEWRRLEPNFFVVFPLGVLEAAPKFYVAAVRAATTDDSARVQRAAVEAFPNVTAIDLALVMQTIDSIFTKVAFVIEFMALFTVITGLIVLVGAVMTGRFQRIRETVLLRTLGATRRQLWQIEFVEYAILGVLAAVVGCGLAMGGNVMLAKYVFRISPAFPVLLLAGAGTAVCVVTVVTGLLSSRGVANHPPLEVLRQET
ncbi:MAG TPA: FtsX-like permease family protein [Opitutaceae bacterium]|nr:FtsX-like permease family protein [Opitutaceae bacterium]